MIVKLLKPLLSDEKFETCISLSLFKNKYSKDFWKYRSRLEKFLPFIPKKSFVRLYMDDSVFEDEDFKKFFEKDNSNIEYYWYQDKRFLLEDGIHHDGTFGSIARFLSLFDDSLNVDYVWVSDIDLFPRSFDYKYITEMKKQNINVSYATSKCYFKKWIPDFVDYPIINWRFIINKKFIKLSKKDFDNFINDVAENKYKDLKEEIESNRYLIEKKSNYNVNKFIYGFDELYSNNFIFNKIKKYKRIVYVAISLYTQRFRFDFDSDKMLEYEQNFIRKKDTKSLKLLIKEHLKIKSHIYDTIEKKYPDDIKIKTCADFFYKNIDKIDINDPLVNVKIIIPGI